MKERFAFLTFSVFTVLVGCSLLVNQDTNELSRVNPPVDGSPMDASTTDGDVGPADGGPADGAMCMVATCDDSKACTLDSCDTNTNMCVNTPVDDDEDMYAAFRVGNELCAGGTDCDDTNGSIHPGAAEICGDGIDNDCSHPSAPLQGDAVCEGDSCNSNPVLITLDDETADPENDPPVFGKWIEGTFQNYRNDYQLLCGGNIAQAKPDRVYYIDFVPDSAKTLQSVTVRMAQDPDTTTYRSVVAAVSASSCSGSWQECTALDENLDAFSSFPATSSGGFYRIYLLIEERYEPANPVRAFRVRVRLQPNYQ